MFAGLLLDRRQLGDRFGRKRALMVGVVDLRLGSARRRLASSPTQVIFTRGLMGIGAALIMPATLSLLTNIFHDPKERGRAIGVWAAVAGGGSALGPMIGGFLLAHFWWGSVFFVNVPVIIVVLIGAYYVLPESKDAHGARLDPLGSLLSIVGLVAVLWAIIEAPLEGLEQPRPSSCARRRHGDRRRSCCGSSPASTRCSTCASSGTAASPPPTSRSPSCCSPCTARPSSAPSTSSSCSATAPLEAGFRGCRWPSRC